MASLVRFVSVWLFLNFFFIVFCCRVSAQEIKKKAFIEAKIVDAKQGKPVVFANVISKARGWWTITDTAGMVKLPGNPGDTITITSIGYFLTRYQITDADVSGLGFVVIPIEEKIYELTKVDIHALGSYEDFKYRLLRMKMFDRLGDVKNKIKLDKDKLPSHPLQEQMAIPLFSPVTAIYNLFSKEGRSKRKLTEALRSEGMIFYAESKYSRSLVARITGLKDDKLDEFIMRYRPTLEYLINATEYDVIGRILSDLELFKEEQLAKKAASKG